MCAVITLDCPCPYLIRWLVVIVRWVKNLVIWLHTFLRICMGLFKIEDIINYLWIATSQNISKSAWPSYIFHSYLNVCIFVELFKFLSELRCFPSQVRCHNSALGGAWTQTTQTGTRDAIPHTHLYTHCLSLTLTDYQWLILLFLRHQ